jgi:hypothetical protein
MRRLRVCFCHLFRQRICGVAACMPQCVPRFWTMFSARVRGCPPIGRRPGLHARALLELRLDAMNLADPRGAFRLCVRPSHTTWRSSAGGVDPRACDFDKADLSKALSLAPTRNLKPQFPKPNVTSTFAARPSPSKPRLIHNLYFE